MRVFITGRPGVGKTTTLKYVVEEVKKRGVMVAGFLCPEAREKGERMGFKIVDLSTGKEGWLAKVGPGEPRVGKYAVQKEAGEVARLVLSSLPTAQLVAIDEIGPMELSIPAVKEVIDAVLKGEKPLVAVVHRTIKLEGKLYVLDVNNREQVRKEVLKDVLKALGLQG
ncbi:MAG: NTPase [Candidatus Aramenus sp.]|jgi:nucleoside-triphosphatase|nr:NTPase [Candidatus Aramenus sp.]